jgi:hypothetical protein
MTSAVTRIVATVGAWFITLLIWIFGRTYRWSDVPWLAGPLGGKIIGDAPYAEVAAHEDLELDRSVRDGGLLPNFDALRGRDFNPERVHPLVREFYEHTAAFSMDVWSKTYFPSRLGLALLVLTISRQVNQLNFPLSPLETAHGISSEIILLRRRDGSIRYTGWFRTLGRARRVLYTGFYMTQRAPASAVPCVKVVFPMPHGNATVLLQPELGAGGSLILSSRGRRFGEPGFYRVHSRRGVRDRGRVHIWRVQTLNERFHVYVDERDVLRCDHTVHFLGLPVLGLHYKLYRH